MKFKEDYLKKILQAIAESDAGSAENVAVATGLDRSTVNLYMEFLDANKYIRGVPGYPTGGVGDREYIASALNHQGRAAIIDLNNWVFQEEEVSSIKYDLSHAKFGGGFATEGGLQIGGMLNDYSINARPDEITALVEHLLGLSQDFPQEQLVTVQETLEDLMAVLQQPEKQTPTRLKRFVGTLLGVAITVGGTVATATDFANNTLELSEKLSIPAETFQPQLQQLKQVNRDFDW